METKATKDFFFHLIHLYQNHLGFAILKVVTNLSLFIKLSHKRIQFNKCLKLRKGQVWNDAMKSKS